MSVAEAAQLPSWAQSVRQKYVGGEASMFLLHGNVFDHVLHGDQEHSLAEFLNNVLLQSNKDLVVTYDPANGIRYLKRPKAHRSYAEESADVDDPLAVLQSLLSSEDRVAIIVHYAGTIAPAGEEHFLAQQDRVNIVRLHQWSMSPLLAAKDNVVILLAESLPEMNSRLVSNPRIAAVQIPLPDQAARAAMIARIDQSIDAANRERLAAQTAGLRLVQIDQILSPRVTEQGIDDADRRALILDLLGKSPDATERAEKLSAITRGMTAKQIHHLLDPLRTVPLDPKRDAYAEVLSVVYARKREIIEKECSGLIEFIDSRHGLEAVGGNEHIKVELAQVADSLRSGDKLRAPMGLLFVGPMGTGKTFVAKAFIKSSGLTAVALKNFRSKWVGSTEANLEKVLDMIHALGPIILVIDEGDRSFGGQSEDSDGGTSSRVIARLKEFMSDPENRGVVVFLLMTNRPDKLDVDIKRAGRLDVKIPFFYEDTEAGVRTILEAIGRRYGVSPGDIGSVARLVGYSNADLEAVVLLAVNYAHRDGKKLDSATFQRAADDYLPSRDTAMLEYMELLAVFESSRRSMLPAKYRDIRSEELNERLALMKASRRY
jgi:transitional endoplasmic reticulum ATPase